MISFVALYILFCLITGGIWVAISIFVDGKLSAGDIISLSICSVIPLLNIIVLLGGIIVLCINTPFVKKMRSLLDKEVYKR